jgi:hypothetical protein
VETEAYLSVLIDYIHDNPLKAGLCTQREEYRWSSARFLAERAGPVDWEALGKLIDLSGLGSTMCTNAPAPELRAEPGRRRRFSDAQAYRLLEESCGAANSTAFLKLDKATQRSAVLRLRALRVPIRQISRICGRSTGLVERWCA